jgi:signal transduction histidine kinase
MNPISRWLNNTSTVDPVDRRNAPFLQILLLFFAVFVPLNKSIFLYAIITGSWKQSATLHLSTDIATDVMLATAAWVALWLTRKGQLQKGLKIFLATAVVCLCLAYASVSLAYPGMDPIPLVLLTLGAMLKGRNSIWLMLGSLCAALLACVALILIRDSTVTPAAILGKAASTAGIWLIVTIVLDRTVAALRNSLEEVEQRSQALSQANLALRNEISEHERTHVQLIHSQKMDATGRLASGLAHDFNNLLAVILGYAQQRRQQPADGEAAALVEKLEDIEAATRRAMTISRKLLNFGRLETDHPESFDAGTTMQELQSMLRQLLSKRIRLQLDLPQTPLPIHMDRYHFELAVLNIAGNSRDAIQGAGTFRVSASVDPGAGLLSLMLSDDGPGMTEATRKRAFEPFFTTKDSGEGTGLGLAIAKDILTKAGGTIAIECPPAGGTITTITLPLVPTAADDRTVAPYSSGTFHFDQAGGTTSPSCP